MLNVTSFQESPNAAIDAPVRVNTEHKFVPGRDGDQIEAFPHVSGVVKNAPGVNDVERSKQTEELLI